MTELAFLTFAGTVVTVTASTLYLCCIRARGQGAQLNNNAVQGCPLAGAPVNAPVGPPQLPPQPVVQPVVVVQPAPTITAVLTQQGTTGGGTRVRITGTNFSHGNVTVRFDNAVGNVVIATAAQLDVDTPPHVVGAVDVRVTNNDGQFAVAPHAFTYMQPQVLAIAPPTGPLLGNNRVRITGRYFAPNVSVLVAGRPAANVNRIDEQTVDADIPARQAPTPIAQGLNIDVVNGNDQSRGRLNTSYTYEPLRLDEVLPASAPSAGGVPLTLRGRGFDAGTTVTIGGMPVGGLAVISPTQIDCTAPALPTPGAALCDVIATSAGGAQTDTLVDAFTYTAPVTLVAMTLSSGARGGNTQVGLLGMGFTHPMVAFFAGQQVNTVFVHEGELIVPLTPAVPHPDDNAHPVDVIARDQGNHSSQLAHGYTYEAERPAMNVVVYAPGQDFNSIRAAGANDASLTGQLLQMHNTGVLDARDGASAAQVPGRTYHNHIAGGVGGLLFNRHAHLRHTIHQVLDVTTHRPANNYSNNLLASNTPNGRWHPNAGVSAPIAAAHDLAMAANFANPAAVQNAINTTLALFSVTPATGAIAGCEQVTLTGQNFPNNVTVHFGGVAVPAAHCIRVNATTLTVTPPDHAPGAVDVRITDARGVFVELPNAFTHQDFALATLTPAIGSHDGGNVVVITGMGFKANTAVSFDGIAVAAHDITVHSSNVLTARAPPHAAGVVNVRLTLGGVMHNLPYRYVQ